MSEKKPKLGAGHASAMFRQGLSELRNSLYPESNVAQPAVYGIAGTRTPGEVMQDKHGAVRDPDEKPSLLKDHIKQAEKENQSDKSREREPRERDRE